MAKASPKQGFQYKVRLFLKVFLIGVIPMATLGFNVFEKTPLYSRLLSIHGVESAITKKLTTQYGDRHRLIIDRQQSKEEFDDLWKLALNYSSAKLPQKPPNLISRLAIENGTFVIIPQKGKVYLIPDSVPVFALYCSIQQVMNNECEGADSVMIGTVGDIKEWLAKRRWNIRSTVDLILSVVSVILGLIVELHQPTSEPNH